MRTCVICGVGIDRRPMQAIVCSKSCATVRHRFTSRRWKDGNKDAIRENDVRSYYRNHDQRLAQKRAYYEENAEVRRTKARASFEKRKSADPQKIFEQQKAARERYLAKYPGRTKAAQEKFRQTRAAALKLVHELQSKGLEALL